MRRRSRFAVAVLLALIMTMTLVPYANAGPKAVNEEVRLQLLAINDFHGQLPPYSSSLGGAALLAGYLDAEEAEAKLYNGDTWRLGVGDLIGASPAVSGLLQDEPTLDILDTMKFKYSTVGNHEFDEGLSELLRLQYGGYSPVTGYWPPLDHLQYLAANVVREDTGEPIFPPYAIEHARGIPVGIIGVVYEGTPSIVTASGVEGLDFLPEADTVNYYVDELKAEGVETIIVLIHNGGAGNTSGGTITGDIVPVVEAMDDEVDVVLSAHSHQRYWGYIDGKLVTQAHSSGRAFADVDLVLDRKTGDVKQKSAAIVPVANDGSIAPNTKIAGMVAMYEAMVAPIVNEVVATAAADITRAQNPAGESALGNLIADGQKWKMGTQIAFMNPGGIRAELLAGEVTWGELFAIQPFSNYMVTMTMTGAQIEQALEQQWVGQGSNIKMLQISGLTYSWSAAAPVGDKVNPAGILLNGVPLDPAAEYTVAANNFLADGGDNFVVFRDATNKLLTGIVDLDALVEYVKQLPQPITPPLQDRVTLLP